MVGNRVKVVALLGALTGLLVLLGHLLGGATGVALALVLAAATNLGAYWFSDRLVLALVGARELAYEDAYQLHELVATLAARAGIPKPRLYLVDSEAPNAFATGRDPEHGVVAVTTGLLRLLSWDELTGVIAHELAHIKHRDTLLQAVAATLAGAVVALADMGRWLAFLGGVSPRADDEDGHGVLDLLGTLLLLLVAPVAAVLIQLAISRAREFQADEGAARLSGDPLALASALARLDAHARATPMLVNPALAPLFIVEPLTGSAVANLFSTHPPIEERIARLRRMAATTPVVAGWWGWPF
ncbi:MAG TPA: M48 family metalloprotease [Chloroflexota bacterium]